MRRTMASQSSLYNEERNLLRIREWERRNQESLQEKEFSQENVPLFGEPYKTNKGDELSSRIQRMLGSYEDVNNPHPCLDSFTKDPSSSSSSSHVMFGRSSHVRPAHTDKAKPPFQGQNPSQYGSGLSGSSSSSGNPSSSHSPQSLKKLPVPEPYGPSPRYSQPSLGHSQGSPPNPHPRKGEAWVDLRECTSLPPVLSAFSPPAEPLSPLHSSDPSDSEPQDTDDKDTPERHQGFAGHPESPGSAMKLSPLDPQRDTAPLPPPPQANKGTVLPSQTFPPPLASKPPNLVMPPKPTAYVRPMDGQDQVVNESPDLKTSPEGFHGQPYEPLPELKTSKPSLSKLKIPSQSIETLSNEVQCVEDILKEMTHSWPPLLTAIHTPSTAESSKFSFPAKEAQHVPPAYPGQKPYGSPPTASQQSSSCTGAAAHSSGVESASSSDSESSSGSESDSESSEGEEAPPPLGGSSPAVKAEGPMVTNWQLNNWIRVSQQNPSTESQGEAPLHSPAPKQPPGHGAEEEGVAAADRGLEFSDNQAKPQAKREGTHNNQHGRHKPPAAVASSSSSSHNPSSQRKTVANKHPSKPAMSSRPDDPRPQAGLRVESVEVAPRDRDPSFTDRPKVKTKMGHGKSGAGKMDAKKSAKRSSSDKRKAEAASQGPKVTLAPDCKREADRGPSPSPRPGPSPAPVEQPSPASAPASAPNLAQTAKTSSKVRTETVPQNGQKKPSGAPPPSSPAPQPSSKRGSSAKASGRPQFPSKALLVKIELSLITRVPQTSKPSQEGQDKPRQKRPPPERREVNKAAPITTKVSRKRPAGGEIKTQPKKKPKLEKEVKIPPSSSSSSAAAATAAGQTSVKSVAHGAPGAAREKKKAKKASPQQPPTPQDPGKAPGQKRPAEDGPSTAAHAKNPPAKHKKSSGKRTEHSKTGKKAPKTSFVVPAATTSLNGRPLLKFEERQYPVEHHMKEAKKLKHKADDTSDKVGKAFNYLDAAMSFVESGIAMETDPQTPKSAYTMFAETLDLIRFIMKLKNSMDPSSPSTERDFTVLCMKGQSLLQMAMFRYKRELALKYSRTLTDHFKSSSKTAQAPSPCISKGTGAPSPMSPMPSPASSSGPGSNHSGGAAASNTVAIPQVIQQVACSYVNITALFLNAHDMWEQAQELAPRGGGVLSELDSALGPLSLNSSMVSLVRYTRQGLHWLRLDTRGTQ